MKKTRLVLKVSGESFSKPGEFGINSKELKTIAKEITNAKSSHIDLAIVVGGGNMIRGASLAKDTQMEQGTTDYMGMLGTVINGLALKDACEALGFPTRLMSALDMPAVAEPYLRNRAKRHFEKNRILILAAGTGNPFFTTDTCAALRGIELEADLLLKATKVDGIYDQDPEKNPAAKKFETLSYSEAIEKELKVMDLTALSMCMENNLPIVVFNFKKPGNIAQAVSGKPIGTFVSNDGQRKLF